ncbi:hypothetical protein TRVL_03218 [Trypanosoma vivax]|nr:hypothetical protein TRVL_03218 [Trypanosoma vivax]
MSSLSYESSYLQALEGLMSAWREDVCIAKIRVPLVGKQRYEQFLRHCTSLYIQYLRAGRRLADVHDVQLQPQKRYDVRTLLDACLARMLELRALLTANCGEYVKLDENMLDMKIVPEELEVPIPRYFVEDNASVLKERWRQIASLQEHYKETEPEAPVSKALVAASSKDRKNRLPSFLNEAVPVAKKMTAEEALFMLKVNERGRQARQRAKFQLAMYAQQRHSVEFANLYNHPSGKEYAATVVQKAVKAYIARKHIFRDHIDELKLIGMRPNEESTNQTEAKLAAARLDELKARQRMNEVDYRQKTLEIEGRIKSEEGPHTMEGMLNEVLTRMAYARMESREDIVPTLPSTEESGNKQFAELVSAQNAAALGGEAAHVAGTHGTATMRSSVLVASDGRGAGRKKGSISLRRKGEEEETAPMMVQSSQWDNIVAESTRYNTIWKPRFVQSYLKDSDLDQSVDLPLLRQQLLEGPRGIMEELRRVVDELIMIEVENLKKRLEQEKRTAGKGKKKKAPKKPRAPKLKDPVKGVDIETFMNSAVHQNVLQLPDPEASMEQYMGYATVHGSPLDALLRTQKPDDDVRKKWQRILANWDANVEKLMKMKKDAFQKLFENYLHQASWLSEPSAAQVRQSVTEYAILPLGSQVIHDLTPSCKTLLLYGFPGTGKTLLVHAICNHSGANLFDLSPSNFETNTGLPGIIQMTFHLAKVMAPSVIYIDKVEKIFMRKKRKGPKDPLINRGKRMKKPLLKAIAGIAPTDRVIVIGTTSTPWEAEFNAMVNNFAHTIYCAPPDYASRIVMLQHYVTKRTGDPSAMTSEHYHELALLTDGLTCGALCNILDEVLTVRRLRRIGQRRLTSSDFIPAITHVRPPTAEEQTQMKDFNSRLPLHLRRINPPVDIPVPEKEAVAKKKPKKKE